MERIKNSPPSREWVTEEVYPMLECKDGSSPTVTTRYSSVDIVNMIDLGHYPMQGVLVQGHYESKKDS